MNDAFSLLEAMSQVAVTLAGFGAIATGLSARSDEDRVDAGRLINMMIASLTTCIATLLPHALALLDLSEEWVWRGAAIIVVAVQAAFMPGALRRVRRMAKLAGFHVLATFINQVLVVLGFILFGLCALGWPAGNLDAMFVASGFAMLTVSAILFFRVVYSMLRSVRPD